MIEPIASRMSRTYTAGQRVDVLLPINNEYAIVGTGGVTFAKPNGFYNVEYFHEGRELRRIENLSAANLSPAQP